MRKYASILLSVLILIFTSCSSGSGLKDKGDYIELNTKDHSLKATKISSPLEDTYILFKANNFNDPESMRYLNGLLVLMPQSFIEKAKAENNNSINPSEKNAAKKPPILRIFVIGADEASKNQIAKIIEMSSKRQHPVIKMTLTEVKVTDLTFKKEKVFLTGDAAKHYIVSKVSILKDNSDL